MINTANKLAAIYGMVKAKRKTVYENDRIMDAEVYGSERFDLLSHQSAKLEVEIDVLTETFALELERMAGVDREAIRKML